MPYDSSHPPAEHAVHHEQEPAQHSEQEQEESPELLQFAAKVFGLAREGGTETLAAYVDAGVPVNLCNDKGDTLVMLAAYHGHWQTVTVLLKRGADPDRPNDHGQTPPRAPCSRGNGP